MAEKQHFPPTAGAEHDKTWGAFTGLVKWASLGTFWIVGMLILVLGLHLPVLPPLIVLSLLVAAAARLLG